MSDELLWLDRVSVEVPAYLVETYWWAYVNPAAVRFFERQWLVNLILWGHFGRLRDAALRALGDAPSGRTLQIACVYGDLTERLSRRIPVGSTLDVVDVLPVQLDNLKRKLSPDSTVNVRLGDSASLGAASASYDRVLLFFLLHEQPESVRRETLAEAVRVVKPGGSIVVLDYHQPHAMHPLRWFMARLLARLEPFALDLWRRELTDWMPPRRWNVESKDTYFGGLYQRVVISTRA
jgi:ubiquinone/menaquinone biosynthesis C-methylase UbiE